MTAANTVGSAALKSRLDVGGRNGGAQRAALGPTHRLFLCWGAGFGVTYRGKTTSMGGEASTVA